MGFVMNRSPFAIAAAALLLSSAATAEPDASAKAEAAASAKPGTTLFAQASEIKMPVAKGDQDAPAKPRRAARVTTCRCADVAPQQN